MEDVYLVIESIDLLTAEEVKKLPENIRSIQMWYWLQSSGTTSDRAACVHPGGFIYQIGNYVENGSVAIRPALLIENLDALKLPLYAELSIFGADWIYIGNNKALYKTYFWKDRFDPSSNEYKTSEIKRKIDKWLIQWKAEYDED